ncbi:MAG TPA: DUF4153 domain-containing protein, partial [Oscillospiraceae bacterium]|nr:DUF4153 domain-containing protein [Oscillospiraceae bacterium]
MNAFSRSVSRIFKGAAKAFQTFPAVIACAIAFSVVALIRIQLDWPEQEAYNFLFNCLQWAFALGAAFSLAAITLAQSRFNGAKAFWIANLSGFAATAATFLALYFAGGTVNGASEYRSVSVLAGTRVSVVIFVCMLAFVVLAGY